MSMAQFIASAFVEGASASGLQEELSNLSISDVILGAALFAYGFAAGSIYRRRQSSRKGRPPSPLQSSSQNDDQQQQQQQPLHQKPESGPQQPQTHRLPLAIRAPPRPPSGSLVVSDLLRKHASDLQRLRRSVETFALYSAKQHDDIFLLRFLLSYPDPKAAAKAVRAALTTRQKYRLDDVAEMVTTTPSRDWRCRTLRPHVHLLPVVVLQPDVWGPAVMYVDAGKMDSFAIMRDVPRELYNTAQRDMMELIFRRMDAATRATGILQKYCRIINLEGVSLKNLCLSFVLRDAEDNNEMQSLYPQLLGAVLFVNTPKPINFLYRRVLCPVLPNKITEKTRVFSCRMAESEREALAAWIPLEHLPLEVSGTGTLTGAGSPYLVDTTETWEEVALAGATASVVAQQAGLSMKEVTAAFFAASDAAHDRCVAKGCPVPDLQSGQEPWWSRRNQLIDESSAALPAAQKPHGDQEGVEESCRSM